VHGRNAAQRSSDPPSYYEIGEIKARSLEIKSPIVIIANGNISGSEDADAVMKSTGCGKLLCKG
jgi:tRNA-dihydrouridine synthase